MAWRTTALADEDIASIEVFGTITFGRRLAEQYVDELLAVFDMIANSPRIVPERDEVEGHVRLYNHRSHRIFYAVEEGGIVVIRVLHASMDWMAHF
jgi:toxin ParE1/3/4